MKNIFTDTISILNKKERRWFFLSVLFSLMVSIGDILSLALLFYTVSLYTQSPSLPDVSFLPKEVFDKNTYLPAAILLLAFVIKSWSGYRLYNFQYRLVSRVVSGVSSNKLRQYMNGSYEDHIYIDSAVQVRKILHQPIEFGTYILSGFQQMITESMLIVFSIVALIVYDIKLLISVSLIMMPAILLISYLTKKRLAGIRTNIKHVNEQTLQYLNESLTGYVESNIYNRNEVFLSRYSKIQSTLQHYIAEMQVTQALPSRFFELFAVFGLCVLILSAIIPGSDSHIPGIFKLGAFIAAAYKIIPGVSKLINLRSIIKTHSYIVKDLKETGITTAYKAAGSAGEKINSILLKNVSFSYKEKQVLQQFTCEIKAGQLTGIKGDSGKGKSTLVNLLLGFLPVDSGDILLNGLVTTASERKLYQQQIAYIKQQSLILHESILNNIVLFEEPYNIHQLNEAIETAGLQGFAEQFKEGLEHIISEDGKNISGGQRQRIAIARALYRNAETIILDEPFNELDEASEKALMKYFKQLSQTGKLVILITHNSESLDGCNTIINLNEH